MIMASQDCPALPEVASGSYQIVINFMGWTIFGLALIFLDEVEVVAGKDWGYL